MRGTRSLRVVTDGTGPPNPALVYLDTLAPSSREAKLRTLNSIARLISDGRLDAHTLQWASLRYHDMVRLRSALADPDRFAVSTANNRLAVVRCVLKQAWRMGQMPADEYHRAIEIERVRGQETPRGRALTEDETRELLRVCLASEGSKRDSHAARLRDAAMLGIMLGAGLRRSEVVALELDDYAPSALTLRIRRAKGRKDRVAAIQPVVGRMLDAWLDARSRDPGPLFVPVRVGTVKLKRMTDKAVYTILAKRGRQAGLARFSPHDLRRTCISRMLDQLRDLPRVARLVGHSSPASTMRYDRRPEAEDRRAAQGFDPFADPVSSTHRPGDQV